MIFLARIRVRIHEILTMHERCNDWYHDSKYDCRLGRISCGFCNKVYYQNHHVMTLIEIGNRDKPK